MTNSHSVITVGPMIVRTREASVGSPTDAWIVWGALIGSCCDLVLMQHPTEQVLSPNLH
jgi:hypothetical protein